MGSINWNDSRVQEVLVKQRAQFDWEERKMDSVAVVSGGMDSVVMLHAVVKNLGYKPTVISFDYHQRSMKELDCATYHANQLGLNWECVSVPMPKSKYVPSDDFDSYVPVRNLVFLSLTAALAEGLGVEKVFMGYHYVPELFWDATPQFMDKVNAVLELNDMGKVHIVAPLALHTKAEVIRLGQRLDVDFTHTWSCYANREKACGVCPICKVRLKTFHDLGMEDPLEYETREVI